MGAGGEWYTWEIDQQTELPNSITLTILNLPSPKICKNNRYGWTIHNSQSLFKFLSSISPSNLWNVIDLKRQSQSSSICQPSKDGCHLFKSSTILRHICETLWRDVRRVTGEISRFTNRKVKDSLQPPRANSSGWQHGIGWEKVMVIDWPLVIPISGCWKPPCSSIWYHMEDQSWPEAKALWKCCGWEHKSLNGGVERLETGQ